MNVAGLKSARFTTFLIFSSTGPEKRVETEESISLAFLVLLEQLQPFERAVFLLREVFEYSFAEIAAMLEKSEAACRRSFSRAKQHLIKRRPRFSSVPEMHRQLLPILAAYADFFPESQPGLRGEREGSLYLCDHFVFLSC